MNTRKIDQTSSSAIEDIFALYRLVHGREPPAEFAERICRKFNPLLKKGKARPQLLVAAH